MSTPIPSASSRVSAPTRVDIDRDSIERVGTTLLLLDQRMTELCDQHGLTPEDLNLDLGPLGTLLPRD
jgi:hypothetical protein